MNILQAAEKVLREQGKPLHYREITKIILEKGLWETKGKTPEATLNANISVDIKKNGKKSLFIRTEPGKLGLREWGLKEIPEKIKSQKEETMKKKASYSFPDAAEKILEEFGDKNPMHYRDITQKALENEFIITDGKTPEASMNAGIIMEIQKDRKQGDVPRFVHHGRGFFGLSKWMGRGLAFEVNQHNARMRKQLLESLKKMAPEDFETLVSRLLSAIGFEEIQVTGRSGDGGIDVRGTLVVGDVIKTRMAVQVKRWKPNIQSPTIQQVRGSLGTHEQGLIITTSDFSPGALKEAERPDATPVGLMNGEQLVKLLVEHEVGASRTQLDLIDLEIPVRHSFAVKKNKNIDLK